MNCWAISRASKIKTVGLCHSVQGTAMQLADDIGVPFEEINYLCAGINHMAFYLRFERKRRGPLPAAAQGDRRRARAGLEPGPLRDVQAAGLFCDRVERAFQRICALVYQARPPGPDRTSSTSRWMSISAAAKTRLPTGKTMNAPTFGRVRDQNRMRRCGRSSTNMARSLSTAWKPAMPRVIYGNVPNHGLIDNLPPGLLRRGALPGG